MWDRGTEFPWMLAASRRSYDGESCGHSLFLVLVVNTGSDFNLSSYCFQFRDLHEM